MGGKTTKPVVEAADAIKALSSADVAYLHRLYQSVASAAPTTAQSTPLSGGASSQQSSQQTPAQQQQTQQQQQSNAQSQQQSQQAQPAAAGAGGSAAQLLQSQAAASSPAVLAGRIDKVRFLEAFIVPRFHSFSSAVHARVLTVVDYRNDAAIDWEEFVCFKFILDYGSREQRLKCRPQPPYTQPQPCTHCAQHPSPRLR